MGFISQKTAFFNFFNALGRSFDPKRFSSPLQQQQEPSHLQILPRDGVYIETNECLAISAASHFTDRADVLSCSRHKEMWWQAWDENIVLCWYGWDENIAHQSALLNLYLNLEIGGYRSNDYKSNISSAVTTCNLVCPPQKLR
jgi:hypothetical protein